MKITLMPAILLLIFSIVGSPSWAADKPPLPLAVQRVLFEAQTMIAEKRLADARLKLESYRRKKESTHYLIEFTLGDIRLLTAEYLLAAKAYRKALELKPDFAPAWMNLGKALYEMGDYPNAADCFHQAYRTAAKPHPERLYYSATASLMAANPQQGLTMFELLMVKHPAEIELEWKPTLVQLYMDLNRPRAALPVIEELAAKSTGPIKAQWQETLLGHYLLLGENDQALAYTGELIRAAPTVPRWWKARSHIHLQQSNYEKALEALMVYAKLTDPDKTEKLLLADLNLQVGIPARAAHYYREIENAGGDAEIVTRLAHALRLNGQPVAALEQIDHFLENKKNPDLLWMKGELLYEMKDYPAAAEFFRRCTADSLRAGRAWLMAGYASWLAKNVARARESFTRASAYPAQKKSALAALKELDTAVIN